MNSVDASFAKFPSIFRSFIQEKMDYIFLTSDGKIAAELEIGDFTTSASLYFSENVSSSIHARMDGVNSLEEIESDYIRNNTNIDDETADKLVEEFKSLWNNIEETVNAVGWKLAYSQGMVHGCWAWWNVIFNENNWNQETFMGIWRLFSDFNKRLNEVFDKYKM
jgi:hypothetical protein